MAKDEYIKIKLVKSIIGVPEKQRKILKALGLGKLNSTVVHRNTLSIRGMVFRVNHLVETERVGK